MLEITNDNIYLTKEIDGKMVSIPLEDDEMENIYEFIRREIYEEKLVEHVETMSEEKRKQVLNILSNDDVVENLVTTCIDKIDELSEVLEENIFEASVGKIMFSD